MSVLPGVDLTTQAGNFPGYVVTFHGVRSGGELDPRPPLVLSSDQYEAEVSLTLDGGLAPSTATITLVGLTDEHHAQVAARTSAGAWERAVVRLHLFWRDANGSVDGYLANLLGLSSLDPLLALGGGPGAATDPLRSLRVAELTVTGVSRRRGSRMYETVVEGANRIAARVSATLAEPVVQTIAKVPGTLASAAGITVDATALAKLGDKAELPFTLPRGSRVGLGFASLAQRLELLTGLYGRGMLLVRDDRLVVGPRPIPYDNKPWPLTWQTGLLSVEAAPPLVTDQGADVETASPAGGAAAGSGVGSAGVSVGAARRDQWTVTLRGRPEIKPGDVVTFVAPVGEGVRPSAAVAVLGSLAAPLFGDDPTIPTTRGYVQGVRHTLSRASGLITVLTVVTLSATEDGWDRRSTPPTATQARGAAGSTAQRPDTGGALSDALERRIAERIATVELAEVGEVRSARPKADGPRADTQRLTVWQGTSAASDGAPHGVVRLPIERTKPLVKTDVPYLTPFAWGKCGLVVPRYPGTRVVSVYRHGLPDDPVEVGAVWGAGEGPDAQAGDWWLSLPVGFPKNNRAAISDDAVPAQHSGAVANDLIDADGHRVVEVANLRVRIGSGGLKQAGTRPEPAPDDTLLSVEHSDGTTLLTIDSSGAVRVVAKGALSLKGSSISLDAGNGSVSITAKTVDVHVSDQMTVQ